MKFIHLTDTHLLAKGDVSRNPDGAVTLRSVIDEINLMHRDAEICVITGDIAHHGRPEQYQQARELFDQLPMPYLMIPGNHDRRAPMQAAFDMPMEDENGFFNQVRIVGGVRFVMLDTLIEGAHHGTLCEKRLAWLSAQLAADPDRPTYLFMHHPPMPMGLPFLDSIRMDADRELAQILADNQQIRHMFFGHLHRPCAGTWQGVPFIVGASTEKGEPLDMRHEKEEELDYRLPLPPMFGIGLCDGRGELSYHFEIVAQPHA